jgi:hypothetical protein
MELEKERVVVTGEMTGTNRIRYYLYHETKRLFYKYRRAKIARRSPDGSQGYRRAAENNPAALLRSQQLGIADNWRCQSRRGLQKSESLYSTGNAVAHT